MRNKIKLISGIFLFFILLFLAALLNRTGSLFLFWKEEPLGSIEHDSGFGYYAFVRDPNIGELKLPFFLKEDETIVPRGPLSVNEDITASIKEYGRGAYQLLDNGDLYLSASDGNPKAHEYFIISPVIIRNRYLLALFVPAALSAAVILWFLLKYKETGMIKKILRGTVLALFVMLLLPWNELIFPSAPAAVAGIMIKPVLQRNVWFLIFLFAFWILCLCFREKTGVLRLLSILIILCNTVYYFVPEWNYFGVRADSGGYLQKYTASSIRTPGYPKFIEGVYKITGDTGLDELRDAAEEPVDERLLDGTVTDSRGLLNVTRAQKIILAAAFLILFAVFCFWYEPGWFVITAQVILCFGFLGVDNSYIMSECLSQAVLLLAAAALMMIFKAKKMAAFWALCILSGCGILIRPANIFLVIPIFAGCIVLIRVKHALLKLAIGGAVFAILCAIPALTIYLARGIFVWMPTSGYVEMARAVDLMEPGDESTFVEDELREFCLKVLDKKAEYPDGDQNTYMWQVAEASAEEMGYDRISCSLLFGKVSRKIIFMHFNKFLDSFSGTIQTAMERTRLKAGPVPFAGLAVLFLVLFAVRVNTDSLLGFILMLMHCAHLCLSMINQPERRYIYSTEILCLLGWTLILAGLTKTAERKNQS